MIPKAPFGKTGHTSTRTLLGAAAFGSQPQDVVDQTMQMILERGINHIDTAADYGDAEERLGPWMKSHRDSFFLATKTAGRTYDAAKASLERSLTRMQTDHVDLLQMHVMVEEDDWQTAMGPGGALEYFIEAKESGITRYIGVTGHGLAVARMHMRSLDRHPFDTVLLPWNYRMSQNETYASEVQALRERCSRDGVAVQTIKSLARGPWGDKKATRTTWYEPFEEQADIDLAVAFVLAQPDLFLNTSGDVNVLPRVLDAAERFDGTAPKDEEMSAMADRAGATPLFV